MARRRSEGGVATVWGLGWLAVCLSIGWICFLAAALVATQHHLDAAADLASLGGAAHLQIGADGCSAAERAAESNGVRLTACRVDGDDIVVKVEDKVALPFGIDGRLVSTARAGPQ